MLAFATCNASILEDVNEAVKSSRAIIRRCPPSPEIHLDVPAFWKRVEERLNR
jgi:hypothetical protein